VPLAFVRHVRWREPSRKSGRMFRKAVSVRFRCAGATLLPRCARLSASRISASRRRAVPGTLRQPLLRRWRSAPSSAGAAAQRLRLPPVRSQARRSPRQCARRAFRASFLRPIFADVPCAGLPVRDGARPAVGWPRRRFSTSSQAPCQTLNASSSGSPTMPDSPHVRRNARAIGPVLQRQPVVQAPVRPQRRRTGGMECAPHPSGLSGSLAEGQFLRDDRRHLRRVWLGHRLQADAGWKGNGAHDGVAAQA
jgi:hypothetical protein